MPELPEVETTTKGLRKTILGLVIKNVWTDLATKDKRQRDSIASPDFFKIFRKEVVGKKILSVKRRAKNILINISGGKTILVHMKMTGHLLYGKYVKHRVFDKISWLPSGNGPLSDPYNRFIHVVFTLTSPPPPPYQGEGIVTHLAFSDARKFGKITLLETETMHESKHLKNIGPEPLDKQFTIKNFKLRILKKPNGKIKTTLMDQSVIAGIGNIYSDEILWRASVNPERKVCDIKENELKKIFKAIKEILAKGINFGGDSMSDYRNIHGLPGKFQLHHQAYRRTGEKCGKKDCNGIIKRKIIGGRSAHFCLRHQS